MTWQDDLLKNLLSYSFIILPVGLICFNGKRLHSLLSPRSFTIVLLFLLPHEKLLLRPAQWYHYCMFYFIPDFPCLARAVVWLIGDTNVLPVESHLSRNTNMQRRVDTPILLFFQQFYNQLNTAYTKVPQKIARALQLLFCIVGLQVSFLTWGILQERMVTRNYNGRRFRDSVFLVFANRCLGFIFGAIICWLKYNYNGHYYEQTDYVTKKYHNVTKRDDNVENYFPQAKQASVPAYKYLVAAVANVMATWFQYEALKFVSFPLQVIGAFYRSILTFSVVFYKCLKKVLSKTCKIIAVMLIGRLFLRKSFTAVQYGIAASVTFGVTLFVLESESNNNQSSSPIYGPNLPEVEIDSSNQLFAGSFLLLCYLTFDSFTSNWEEHIFHDYPNASNFEMMTGVSGWGTLLTTAALSTQSGFKDAWEFMYQSQEFTSHVVLLALSSAAGSLFIYYTISKFGAVAFVTIMTVRQALAIFLSCLIYGHAITPLGFFGLIFVFAALGFQSALKKNKSSQISRYNKESMTSSEDNLKRMYRDSHVVIPLNSSKI